MGFDELPDCEEEDADRYRGLTNREVATSKIIAAHRNTIAALKTENLTLRRGCRFVLNTLRCKPPNCLGIRGGIETGTRQRYVRDAVIRELEVALGE